MATTKKKTIKKETLKDTGAMDEFLGTMVGNTLKEEDIVVKKPKAKAAEPPKADPETVPEEEAPAQLSEIQKFSAPENEQTNEDADWGDEGTEELNETKIDRITAVTDESGKLLYYKVPADCEELQDIVSKEEFGRRIAKLIADDIYKNTECSSLVADITPEVVAPKPMFPFRVVNKW